MIGLQTSLVPEMATVENFKGALRDALEAQGTMRKLQAQVRAQIINSLADPKEQDAHANKPTSSQTGVINELIREYLEFQGYRSTLSVFTPEAGLAAHVERETLERTLDVAVGPQGQQVPLLYTLAQRRNNN